MIFVFDRSFAVGFCPSIQMYSAVILANAAALLLNALRENSMWGQVMDYSFFLFEGETQETLNPN
jgi:hypothetical protein